MEEKVTNDALVAQRESSRLLSGWLQVRVLPGALMAVRRATRALVAQWQSTRLLSGCVQVQVLPGALTVRPDGESEAAMERLISLFREPDYESPLDESEQRPPQADEEPVYFRQLLECLRQQKESASEPSDELIGA
jgi:hypothetical protein